MVTFQPYDMGNSETELHTHAGQTPVSVAPLDPSTYNSADVGPMYSLTFSDGFKTYAFADEVIGLEPS